MSLFSFFKRQKPKKQHLEPPQRKTTKDEPEENIDSLLYRDYIIKKFKTLDFTGLNSILPSPIPQKKIFVKPRVKQSFHFTHYPSIADNKKTGYEKSIEMIEEDFAFVFHRLHNEYSNEKKPLKLVILGKPGSGKTTLLKCMALQCALTGDTTFSGLVPVLIPLKNLGQHPDKTFRSKNIKNLAIDIMEDETISSTFIAESFETNKIMFLLDGLNEVEDKHIRKEIIDWIQKQDILQNTLLVTSRLSGLSEAEDLKFNDEIPAYTIQDFNIIDTEMFLENWRRFMETAIEGEDKKNDSLRKFKKQYTGLINTLTKTGYPNFLHLTETPLLLTLSVVVHYIHNEIPNEPHKLVEKFLETAFKTSELSETDLPLTLREYVAARHFAKNKNLDAILEYRDKDHWNEIITIYSTLIDSHKFFNPIIDNLLEKEYWRRMNLWEDCLLNIHDPKTQREIEIKFAKKILDILPQLDVIEENEPLITQLYAHYSLYKHADLLVQEGWRLFNNAKHPFLQSVGASILNKADEKTQTELIELLKTRINHFEIHRDKNSEHFLNFLYQNNNSFLLLITGRKNILDFYFTLEKLKSPNPLLIYTALLELTNIHDFPVIKEIPYPRDIHYPRSIRDIRDMRYIHDIRDMRFLRDIREISFLQDIQVQFLEKYEHIIDTHKKEIYDLAEKEIATLHSLHNDQLLKYFPGASLPDLKEFRHT